MKKYILSIFYAICTILIIAVSITNIIELNKTENVNFEEYLKIAVFMSFGLLTAYASIIMVKPDFELLKTLFKLSSSTTNNVLHFSSILIMSVLTVYFVWITVTGLIAGEMPFYGHREVDWVLYEKNKTYFLAALLQNLFGIFAVTLFWSWKIKSTKHEKSNK